MSIHPKKQSSWVLLAKWITEAIKYEIELDHNITSLSALHICNLDCPTFIPKWRRCYQKVIIRKNTRSRKSQVKKQTAAHGKCGDPIFPEAKTHGTHQTFLQNDLTNIKLYLYFFFLPLRIHEVSAANWSTPPYFPCKMGNFFLTRLTLLISSSILFAFFFILMLFRTKTFASFFLFCWHESFSFLFLYFFANFLCIFTLSYVFNAPGPGSPAWREARSSNFPCGAWTQPLAWKNLLPFFDSLHLAFSWNYAPSPHFSRFHAWTGFPEPI